MQIEKALYSDLGQIKLIESICYPKHLHDKDAVMEKILLQEDSFCFIAKAYDCITGYLIAYPTNSHRNDYSLGYRDTVIKDCIYIHDLCVRSSNSTKGVGTLLLNALQEALRLTHFQKIIGISVNQSTRFWEKKGFSVTSTFNYNGETGYKIEKMIAE